MHKTTLRLLGLLLTLWLGVFAQSTTSEDKKAGTSPRIVAKVALQGQSAAIPRTVLFTPTADGLYRLTVYIRFVSVQPPPATFEGYITAFSWTDVVGAQILPIGVGASQPAFQSVQALTVRAGTPFTYEVSVSAPPPQQATYSLFFTVEHLE